MLILNELNFNSFSVGRVWWSFQNLFLTVSTFGGFGGHEESDC